MNNISSVGNLNFRGDANIDKAQNPSEPKINLEQEPDMAKFSNRQEYNGPKIGIFRILFSRLTDEQIKAVNETKRLPKNAKFTKINGNFAITNNFFSITPGTKTMPAGYELKKGLLGFTIITPKDTEGLFIKDAK